MGHIYMIRQRSTGMVYIGQTRRDLQTRWRQHRTRGSAVTPFIHLFGVDDFEFSIVEVVAADVLNDREVFWIKHHDCMEPKGFNRTAGGSTTQGSSPATRAKISAANRGKVRSPEAIEKMAAAKRGKKGRKQSVEWVAKRCSNGAALSALRQAGIDRRGKRLPEQHRERLAIANKARIGTKASDETRAKISAVQIGRRASAETRAKMSETRRGRVNPPESYAKGWERRRMMKASQEGASVYSA
jgi:group I intron endonuclease